MNLRVAGLVALVLGLLVAPLLAQSQRPGRTARVGILVAGSQAPEADTYTAFRQGLRERGWIEGQNLVLDFRYADNHYDRLSALATELVALKPDAIFAVASPAIRAAAQATSTIPIIIETLGDAVSAGLVSDLALHVVDVREARELAGAFDKMARHGADALVVVSDPMLHNQSRRVIELAARHRLPAVYEQRLFPDGGGLLSYGPGRIDRFQRSAVYVDRVLRGARPAELPLERPTKFELVIIQ